MARLGNHERPIVAMFYDWEYVRRLDDGMDLGSVDKRGINGNGIG